MKFCPQCHNSFNISKTITETNIQIAGSSSDMSLEEIVTLLANNLPVDPLLLEKINIEDLKLKSYFKKLKALDKDIVINTISHNQKKEVFKSSSKQLISESLVLDKHNIAYFKCSNCGYYEQIVPQTLIFSKVNNNAIQNIMLSDYTYMIYDNTLPRTKEYVCNNINCSTHKQPNQKEAVFIRAPNTYQLIYICTICKTNWIY